MLVCSHAGLGVSDRCAFRGGGGGGGSSSSSSGGGSGSGSSSRNSSSSSRNVVIHVLCKQLCTLDKENNLPN